MLGFTSKAFRTAFSIVLWVVLVVCAFAGAAALAGSDLGILMSRKRIFMPQGFTAGVILRGLGGFIGGGVIGLVIIIIGGGFVSNFLKMEKDIGEIWKDVFGA